MVSRWAVVPRAMPQAHPPPSPAIWRGASHSGGGGTLEGNFPCGGTPRGTSHTAEPGMPSTQSAALPCRAAGGPHPCSQSCSPRRAPPALMATAPTAPHSTQRGHSAPPRHPPAVVRQAPVVGPALHVMHHALLLEAGDERQEEVALEATLVEGVRVAVGGGNKGQAAVPEPARREGHGKGGLLNCDGKWRAPRPEPWPLHAPLEPGGPGASVDPPGVAGKDTGGAAQPGAGQGVHHAPIHSAAQAPACCPKEAQTRP